MCQINMLYTLNLHNVICHLYLNKNYTKKSGGGFPGDSVVKNLPANEGDMSSVPDLGRSHMAQSN